MLNLIFCILLFVHGANGDFELDIRNENDVNILINPEELKYILLCLKNVHICNGCTKSAMECFTNKFCLKRSLACAKCIFKALSECDDCISGVMNCAHYYTPPPIQPSDNPYLQSCTSDDQCSNSVHECIMDGGLDNGYWVCNCYCGGALCTSNGDCCTNICKNGTCSMFGITQGVACSTLGNPSCEMKCAVGFTCRPWGSFGYCDLDIPAATANLSVQLNLSNQKDISVFLTREELEFFSLLLKGVYSSYSCVKNAVKCFSRDFCEGHNLACPFCIINALSDCWVVSSCYDCAKDVLECFSVDFCEEPNPACVFCVINALSDCLGCHDDIMTCVYNYIPSFKPTAPTAPTTQADRNPYLLSCTSDDDCSNSVHECVTNGGPNKGYWLCNCYCGGAQCISDSDCCTNSCNNGTCSTVASQQGEACSTLLNPSCEVICALGYTCRPWGSFGYCDFDVPGP